MGKSHRFSDVQTVKTVDLQEGDVILLKLKKSFFPVFILTEIKVCDVDCLRFTNMTFKDIGSRQRRVVLNGLFLGDFYEECPYSADLRLRWKYGRDTSNRKLTSQHTLLFGARCERYELADGSIQYVGPLEGYFNRTILKSDELFILKRSDAGADQKNLPF
jgi:hypothetical protein